jgi:ABC-type lipoprotein export system ATPase subunit
MALLDELNAQGKTIVMVTHEPDIAAHAACRLHMRDGHIERLEGQES